MTHTLDELKEEHGVNWRADTDGTKFSLNYDQIASKETDPLACQCRGLVLRPKNLDTGWKDNVIGETTVLAYPMDRFFNLGQDCVADVDFSDPILHVLEKLDGTMVCVYFDPLKEIWCTATRSVPEADLPINDLTGDDMTFGKLFRQAYAVTTGRQFECHLEESSVRYFNYVFELTTPFNRIVVKYDDWKVTLLAVRELIGDLSERRDANKIAEFMGYPVPERWNLYDPKTIAAAVNLKDPKESEGVVVVDSKFRRMKIKSEAYVLASKMKDGVTSSRRNALFAAIEGRLDDVIPLVCDETRAYLRRMQDALREWNLRTNNFYVKCRDEANGDRKTFARLVTANPHEWHAVYFSLLDGRGFEAIDVLRNLASHGRLCTRALDTLLKNLGLDR